MALRSKNINFPFSSSFVSSSSRSRPSFSPGEFFAPATLKSNTLTHFFTPSTPSFTAHSVVRTSENERTERGRGGKKGKGLFCSGAFLSGFNWTPFPCQFPSLLSLCSFLLSLSLSSSPQLLLASLPDSFKKASILAFFLSRLPASSAAPSQLMRLGLGSGQR